MIPLELQKQNRWVCALNDRKMPMKAFGFEAASSTDPSTWATYEEAREMVERGIYDYVGYVFANDGYVGIDIDDGVDDDGLPIPLAADIISHTKSYTELSKSGSGYHIIVKGELPFNGKNNLQGVEIYKTQRYFIMTGDTKVYTDIITNQEAIDYVIQKYFKDEITNTTNQISTFDRIYAPIWQWGSKDKIPIRPKYPMIHEGSRNVSLLSLGGQLLTQGYSGDQVRRELAWVNKHYCDKPLDRSELESICRSVLRYTR